MGMRSDLIIYASELIRAGVNPQNWTRLNKASKQALASQILNGRGTPGAAQAAYLIETNNPNALQQLALVWDV